MRVSNTKITIYPGRGQSKISYQKRAGKTSDMSYLQILTQLELKNSPEKQGHLVLIICQNYKGKQLAKEKHRAAERPSKSSNASHDVCKRKG